ncbi:MAG: hypothetical protein KKB70_12290 [Proteobacteria bacterium]|nr:hypothetical protein [Pseudomonadota bacterium]
MPRLENWWFKAKPASKTLEPGKEGVLFGNIVDDDAGRFPDGHFIRTSLITDFDPMAETVQTRNTVYTLGKPLKQKEESNVS